MSTTITMGRRGTVTVPANLRQQYGIKQNDLLIVEDTPDGILLRPAVSVPVELYSEDRIAEFASEDQAVGRVLKGVEPGAAAE
ncbi:MAG: AbrB/MazE/SpoVT family DNA-binding domain-containing protein [Terrimicrobiaceae bacterium]